MTTTTQCRHCGRGIVLVDGSWIDPEASGDDIVWRETCEAHDTFVADHEPTESAQDRAGYEKCFNCWTEVIDDSNPHEPDHFIHLVTLKEACHPDDLRAASMDTDPTIGYVATPTPPADDEGY